MTPIQWKFDSLPKRVSSSAPNTNIVPREVKVSTNPIGKLSADGIPIAEGANFLMYMFLGCLLNKQLKILFKILHG
jgi:hypothetical protein